MSMKPRTPEQTSEALKQIYSEEFAGDSFAQFLIEWADLRALAGGAILNDGFISRINNSLSTDNYCIACFDDYLLFTEKSDLHGVRKAKGRILEQFMPDVPESSIDEDDELEFDDEDED